MKKQWLYGLISVLVAQTPVPLLAQDRVMPVAASAAIAKSDASLDATIARLMREQRVPGLSIGVIEGGQVKYMKAYGWRDAQKKQPMSPQTLMAIGSNTKSFTGILSAMLVDEKRLDLDRPIKAYLPQFTLRDEYAAAHLTMRDLLTHNSGLAGHAVALWGSRFPGRETVLSILANLEPSASFRQKFQYNNITYMLASYVQEEVANQRWDDLLRDKLLTPIGMTASTATLTQARNQQDVAVGHQWGAKGWKTQAPYDGRFATGAGALYSNIPDMLRYMQFRLDGYQVNGKPLLSPEMVKALDRPYIVDDAHYAERMGYGFGVEFMQRGPYETIRHGGGIDHFSSQMVWVPEKQLGVVVLTNAYAEVANEVSELVLNEMLGPLSEEDAQKQKTNLAPPQPQSVAAATKPAPPFAALSAYAGEYENPAYGPAQIERRGKQLFFVYGKNRVALKHKNANVFVTIPSDVEGLAGNLDLLAGMDLSFSGTAQQPITRFEAVMYPGTKPLVFERKTIKP